MYRFILISVVLALGFVCSIPAVTRPYSVDPGYNLEHSNNSYWNARNNAKDNDKGNILGYGNLQNLGGWATSVGIPGNYFQNIFRSAYPDSAEAEAALALHNIKYTINFSNSSTSSMLPPGCQTFNYFCDAQDQSLIAAVVNTVWRIMQIRAVDPIGGIDIHCNQGSDRTGLAVSILALLQDSTLSFDSHDILDVELITHFGSDSGAFNDFDFLKAIWTGGSYKRPEEPGQGAYPGTFLYTYKGHIYSYNWTHVTRANPSDIDPQTGVPYNKLFVTLSNK